MIKLLAGAAAAAVLLFVFCMESPGTARGQGVGVYRGRQGRRVGRVTLPTPPFNPNAGILDRRGVRGQDSPKTTRRRPARRSVKAVVPRTPRRRRVRRGRNVRQFVGAHGGPVSVNSELGRGSAFRFTIPPGTG